MVHHVEVHATNVEWAYLAGIVDGEGCISTHRAPNGRKRPMLTVVQKYPIALFWIEERFGGYLHEREVRTMWRVTGGRFKAVIEGMKPYLTLKKPQAVVALAMLDADYDRTYELAVVLSKLKRIDMTRGSRGRRRRR